MIYHISRQTMCELSVIEISDASDPRVAVYRDVQAKDLAGGQPRQTSSICIGGASGHKTPD